jgi:hypothetical protein
MSLTTVAMMGILLGFVCLVVGFLMEGPRPQADLAWTRKAVVRKTKKRVKPVRRAA